MTSSEEKQARPKLHDTFRCTRSGTSCEIDTVGHNAYEFHNRLQNVLDPNIEKLVIHAYPRDVDLSPLEVCTNLRYFGFDSTTHQFWHSERNRYENVIEDPTTSIDFSPLGTCTELREFELDTNVPEIHFSFAASCSDLRGVARRECDLGRASHALYDGFSIQAFPLAPAGA